MNGGNTLQVAVTGGSVGNYLISGGTDIFGGSIIVDAPASAEWKFQTMPQ